MSWNQPCEAGGRRRTVVALSVLVAALLFASSGWAGEGQPGEETTPRMFALPADSIEGQVSSIVADRIDESVRDRFDALDGVELMPTMEVLEGEATGAAAAAAVEQARNDYTSGIGLVRAGEYEEAAEILQTAVTVLEENVAELEDFDVLADAKANLAIAYHQIGYDLDARDAIEHYAHLQPDAELDPDTFPAELRELFGAEVDLVERAGTATLDIEANHEGADVYVDGEHRGETPVSVENVPYGERFVVVRDGELEWSERIMVRGRDEQQDVQADLADPDEQEDPDDQLPGYYVELREMLRSGQFGQELTPYLEELARQTGADYISWVLVVPDDGDYAAAPFLFRAEDQTVIQEDNVVFDRQLSNLRAGSDQLSHALAAAVVHMPDDRIVTDQVDIREQADEEEMLDEEELAALEQEQPDEQPDDPHRDDQEDEVAEQEDHEQVAVAPQQQPDEQLPVPDEPADAGIGDGLPDEHDDSTNTLRYLGWGGAAAAATGAIATTVILLMGNGDPAGPGFDAEVEW